MKYVFIIMFLLTMTGCSNKKLELDNINLIKYNDTTCTSNNWLYKNNIYLWLLNMNNTRSYICWGINDTGRASTEGYDCTNTISVKPTLYLNENVMITSGDGSSSSPYQLAN